MLPDGLDEGRAKVAQPRLRVFVDAIPLRLGHAVEVELILRDELESTEQTHRAVGKLSAEPEGFRTRNDAPRRK